MMLMGFIEENARRWWIHLILGVWSIIFAVLAIAWPSITLIVLVALVAAYAFIHGVLEILLALQLRRLKRHLTAVET